MTLQAGISDAAAHGSAFTSYAAMNPQFAITQTSGNPTSTAWPANNDAYAVPFLVASPVSFSGAFFGSGTSPGTTNFDIGIYRDDWTRITSLGATACVNNSQAMEPAAGGAAFASVVTLPRGRYYMAMSSAATTLTVRGFAPVNQGCRILGMFKMASAHPLPDPFVPASMGTTAFIPVFGLIVSGASLA